MDTADNTNNTTSSIISFCLISKVLINIIVSLLLSFGILAVFTYFYGHTLGLANPDKTTDEKWYPNQFMSNMEEGFSWLRCDESGFNNYCIPNGRTDILLMGSSHTEALQISQKENYGYLLNKLLPHYFTYNIGISGHFLLTNVNNLANAYEYYQPQKCVVVETFKINYSAEDFMKVCSGRWMRMEPNDKGINYYIKKYIPIAKSLGKRIINKIDLWKSNSGSIELDKQSLLEHTKLNNNVYYGIAVNNFLKFTRNSIPNNVSIIILYHHALELDSVGRIRLEKEENFDLFVEACKNNNIVFVDTTFDMINLYKTRHILPNGFINTKVGVGHLNKYGHEIIANRLAKVIKSLDEVVK